MQTMSVEPKVRPTKGQSLSERMRLLSKEDQRFIAVNSKELPVLLKICFHFFFHHLGCINYTSLQMLNQILKIVFQLL